MWCAQSSLLSIISFSNIHMQGQKESSQCTPAELRDMQVDKVMTTFSGTCMTYNAISKCHLHPWTSKVVRNSGLWWTWLLRDDKGYLCWSMCQKLMPLGSFLDNTEKKNLVYPARWHGKTVSLWEISVNLPEERTACLF